MATSKSISVTDAANTLEITEKELRELLKEYYKTYETIQRISTKNFEEIATKISEAENVAEDRLEVETVDNQDVQFELIEQEASTFGSQANGNGYSHQIDNGGVEQVTNGFNAEFDSLDPTQEILEEENSKDFLSSQTTNDATTEPVDEDNQQEQSRKRAEVQRQEDIKLAWETTAKQATEFATSLEEGFWLITAAARSSDEVQNSDRVTKARDLAMGIGDGGMNSSAHIKSVEKYLKDKGFFPQLLNQSEEPKQLTS